MSAKLEQQFKKAYQDFIRKPKIEKHISLLNKKLKKLKKQTVVLHKFMEKEYLDIEGVEKKGLKSTFKSFLGTLEEALNKERQEYLLAVLNFQAHEREIAAVEFELNILSKKLIELGDVEKRFNKLKNRYFISFNLNNSSKGKKIRNIKEQIIKLNSSQAELREAHKMALKAEEGLEKLKTELEKIEFWGVPDSEKIMKYNGKGRFSSYKKKRFIDRTKSLTFKVNGILNRFDEELADVSNTLKIDFSGEINSIQEFLNIFFDNLITDWIVRHKINTAFMALDMIHDKILRIDQMLDFENERIEEAIKELMIKQTEIMLD